MTTVHAEEEVEKLDYSHVASRNIKWYNCSEKWSGGFLQNYICNATTIWPSNWAFIPEKWKLWPSNWAFIPEKWKLKLIHICRSFTNNSQKLESAQMSFNWWMVKQTVVYPHQGLLLSNEKEHHWYMQRLYWIFRALCWVNKVNPKRLHTVWFHLYNILNMTKKIEMKTRLVVARG